MQKQKFITDEEIQFYYFFDDKHEQLISTNKPLCGIEWSSIKLQIENSKLNLGDLLMVFLNTLPYYVKAATIYSVDNEHAMFLLEDFIQSVKTPNNEIIHSLLKWCLIEKESPDIGKEDWWQYCNRFMDFIEVIANRSDFNSISHLNTFCSEHSTVPARGDLDLFKRSVPTRYSGEKDLFDFLENYKQHDLNLDDKKLNNSFNSKPGRIGYYKINSITDFLYAALSELLMNKGSRKYAFRQCQDIECAMYFIPKDGRTKYCNNPDIYGNVKKCSDYYKRFSRHKRPKDVTDFIHCVSNALDSNKDPLKCSSTKFMDKFLEMENSGTSYLEIMEYLYGNKDYINEENKLGKIYIDRYIETPEGDKDLFIKTMKNKK